MAGKAHAEGRPAGKDGVGSGARAQAARAVAAVLAGRSLSEALPPLLASLPERDRGLAQELAFGVLREFEPLAFLAEGLVKSLPKPTEVFALLLVGLYQLIHTRMPEHAVVHATVEATRTLKAQRLSGLVNGVLRSFMREREACLARLEGAAPATRHALPGWLWARLGRDWPGQEEAIASALRQRPPMTLRVHAAQGGREAYLARLAEAGLAAEPTCHAPFGVRLAQPQPIERLPGFAAGEVSVQDEAAQLCADLVELRPRLRVLDACAAPGGKTLALLEREPGLAMLALDSDARRLARVRENLARAGLAAEVRAADAGDPPSWWDGTPFDLILLDAPCSATGVIRRHPDIKRLRRETDIAALARQQDRLLDALWPLLAPGGHMLYMTCSILREENDARIDAFLQRRADAAEQPIEAGWGHPLPHGRQILPGEDGMDGFYYCLLARAS
ncbi:MAG: 16S rRNA (cytosine(967)-C(5))-methyltransferase RsmB [Gammaproteobacteria bacterium]|nr:16S rRNA (cytosine(967)-C(5))-methyltransferase RsmB [Gammaproteobacteria bacterium]